MPAGAQSNFQQALFRVLQSDGSTNGTAFAVADGILVTCTHVVNEPLQAGKGSCAVIHQETGRKFTATLISSATRADTEEDIATLRIDQSNTYARIIFGRFSLTAGDRVYSFGFPEPKSVEGMPGGAVVVGESKEAGHSVWVVESDQFTAGFSGGPAIFEASDLVVGVIVSIVERPDAFGRLGKTAFVVPAETVLGICPFAQSRKHPSLDRYCASIQTQLNRSAYFFPSLPPISLTQTFQVPQLEKLSRVPNDAPIQVPFRNFRSALDTGRAKICLIGDAGSGKSTILRHSAIALAKSASSSGSVVPIYMTAKSLAKAKGLTIEHRFLDAQTHDSYYAADGPPPQDFMNTWPSRMRVRFVVFVDACDEINVLRDRILFLRYLNDDLAPYLASRNHSLVISSRDVGQLEGIKRNFDVYRVVRLASKAPARLAKSILGPSSDDFAEFLARLTNRHLVRSPLSILLLLTIYHNPKNGQSRSDWELKTLYECYLEMATDELRQRGIERAVPSDVVDLSRYLLELMALRDVSERFHEQSLLDDFSAFLASETRRGPFSSEREARRLINFLSEDGGLFSLDVEGGITWVHQNFRDYLAACFAAGPRGDAALNITELIEGSWRDAGKETFARFLVAMTASRPDVLSYSARLLEQDRAFALFLSRAIADGASFGADLPRLLAKNVFADASVAFGRCQTLFTSFLENPVETLKLVVWKEPYLSTALGFLTGAVKYENITKPGEFRSELLKGLSETIADTQLDSVVADEVVRSEIRAVRSKTASPN